jgi:hypothetical protein
MDPIIICGVFTPEGAMLAEQFYTAGRCVIGIDSEIHRGTSHSIDRVKFITKLFFSERQLDLAAAISSVEDHCEIIDCAPELNKYSFKETT